MSESESNALVELKHAGVFACMAVEKAMAVEDRVERVGV